MIDDNKLSLFKQLLGEAYPKAKTELICDSPFQLLVAALLSAQTTDKQVNKITRPLFKKYSTPEALLTLSQKELEEKIKHLGLYRHKSRHLLELCRILLEEHAGEVPKEREKLMALPGVGRKTANVVLANAFGIPAFAVDTHVGRVSRRLGLTEKKEPIAVEQDLCNLFPPEEWHNLHHQLILHGRKYCIARRPRCNECFLNKICPSRYSVTKKEDIR